MNGYTQDGITHIAGMELTGAQMEALRSWFREEWQREEIRDAISVIIEVLASHDDGQPDGKIDKQLSLLLLHKSIQEDIVDRFHHKVPEWNEEALQEANDHDVGVWRSLYDLIVPEMRAKLRTEDADMRTYQVNGKTYTESEVMAIYDMWQEMQDYKTVSEAVDAALEILDDPDIDDYAHDNDPEIMEQCLAALPDWRKRQRGYLAKQEMLLHHLICDRIMDMYMRHNGEEA